MVTQNGDEYTYVLSSETLPSALPVGRFPDDAYRVTVRGPIRFSVGEPPTVLICICREPTAVWLDVVVNVWDSQVLCVLEYTPVPVVREETMVAPLYRTVEECVPRNWFTCWARPGYPAEAACQTGTLVDTRHTPASVKVAWRISVLAVVTDTEGLKAQWSISVPAVATVAALLVPLANTPASVTVQLTEGAGK